MEHQPVFDPILLAGGSAIPAVGLGVFRSASGVETEQAVTWALEAGYRHIDTARSYGNEDSVGRAIARSGLPRREIFLTTKLLNADVRAGRAAQAVEESFSLLGTDYIDLFLIHWPVEGWQAAWRVLEDGYRQGRLGAIGVSNFQIRHLEELLDMAHIQPAVNQFECHPHLQQRPLLAYCKKARIQCEAYSPLGGPAGTVLKEPVVRALAAEKQRTEAQIVLRWQLQRGLVVLPKSVHQARIISNRRLFDFELTEEEMARIDALECGRRYGRDPDHIDF